MTLGTNIDSEGLQDALLAVVGAARDRLTIMSPVVEPAVLDVLREHLRDQVEVEVVSRPGCHAKLVVADHRVAMVLSMSLISGGTGIAFDYGDEDRDDDEGRDEADPRQPNINCGLVIEDAEVVEKLLTAISG